MGLKGPLAEYAKWFLGEKFGSRPAPKLPAMPGNLRGHAEWAADKLQESAMEISGTMRKHQLKLADRQCRMSELSSRIQSLIVHPLHKPLRVA